MENWKEMKKIFNPTGMAAQKLHSLPLKEV